jgi:hypothetical protein
VQEAGQKETKRLPRASTRRTQAAAIVACICIGIFLRVIYAIAHPPAPYIVAQYAIEGPGTTGSQVLPDPGFRLGAIPLAIYGTILKGGPSRNSAYWLLAINLGFTLLTGLILLILIDVIYPHMAYAQIAGTAIYAFHMPTIVYCCSGPTYHTLAGVLLLLLVLLAWHEKSTPAPENVIYSAAAWSALALTRTILAASAMPAILVFRLRNDSRKRVWSRAAMFVGLVGILISPWIFRNYLRHKAVVPISGGGGVTLLWGTLLDYTKPRYELEDDITNLRLQFQQDHGIDLLGAIPNDDDVAARLAIGRILANPSSWIKGVLLKFGAYWYSDFTPWRSLAGGITNSALLGLVLLGIGIRDKNREVFLLSAIVILSINTLYAFLHAIAQYSVAVIPLVCALAAGPASQTLQWLLKSDRFGQKKWRGTHA